MIDPSDFKVGRVYPSTGTDVISDKTISKTIRELRESSHVLSSMHNPVNDSDKENHRYLLRTLLQLPKEQLEEMSHPKLDCYGVANTHRELAKAFAYEGIDIEYKHAYTVGVFRRTSTPFFLSMATYRKAQEYMTINGFSVPKPLTEPLKNRQYYFVESPTDEEGCMHAVWEDDNFDYIYLQRGIAHISEENALICMKARLGIDPYRCSLIDLSEFKTPDYTIHAVADFINGSK